MKKYILVFGGFILQHSIFAQNIVHKELLGRPEDKSIEVQLFFDADVDVSAQFGTDSTNFSGQTAWQSFKALEPCDIKMAGLKQNTRYFYRVQYRATGTTSIKNRPIFNFTTQRPTSQAFTFVIQADPHLDVQSDTNVYKVCLNNQLADKPDFMIDLGDFIMTDKLTNSKKQVLRDTVTYRAHLLRHYYENISHSIPVFNVLGNHEAECGWYLNGTSNNMAIWCATDRKKYFKNPEPDGFFTGDTTNNKYVGKRQNYYSWTWGDAQFIVIDPYWYTMTKPDSLNGWRWSLGKAQYDWLKQTLELSTSKYKFIFGHQLVGGDPLGRGGIEYANRYEWGGNNLDGSRGFETQRPGWYKPIKDLLAEHRATIFFHGHDHFFGKQDKECLVYQETPQPSHPNFSTVNYATAYGYKNGTILPNSGHLRVNVAPTGVKVEYVRAYVPASESSTRHNRDVSASYMIGAINCYDSAQAGVPIVYNKQYGDEMVFPNPFQRETTISFNIQQNIETSCAIYSIDGKRVRQLIQPQTLRVGEYLVSWDGKSDSNQPLPDGTYIYKIDGINKSGKIVLKR